MESSTTAERPAPLPRRPALKPRRRRGRHLLPPAARYTLIFFGLVVAVLLAQLAVHVIQTEPRDVQALVEREIRLTVLEPGERVYVQVPVVQRSPLNYYRATRGVLMLTDQRLVYLGLLPRDFMASPDAPPAFIQEDFPIDTATTVEQTRVFFYLTPGLAIDGPDGGLRLGAASGDWPRAQQLQRTLAWQHAGLRAEASRRVAQAAAVRAAHALGQAEARKPRYHVVQSGEALASIARLYETTPERIQQLNQLAGNLIKSGMRLRVM